MRALSSRPFCSRNGRRVSPRYLSALGRYTTCERVTAKAVQIAGALLHIDPQDVTMEEGKFFGKDIPDRHVTWAEVSREAYDPHHLPSDLERGLEATAYWEPLAYTYPCSASVAVVELDTETGKVQLTKYIYVDDCGTVINPLIVEGQVHGGLAQGIGAALLEEAVWDDRGQLVPPGKSSSAVLGVV